MRAFRKILNFFFEPNWKSLLVASIFYALFVYILPSYAEVDKLKVNNKANVFNSENTKELSKQLADVLLNLETEKLENLKIKSTAADLIGSYSFSMPADNMKLLEDLKINTEEGKYLIKKTLEISNYLDKEIEKLSIPDTDKVRLQLAISELKSNAVNYALTINRPLNGLANNSIEVIDTNNNLNVVILGAGFVDGIKVGLNLTCNIENKPIKMVVVSVKKYLSAAIVTEGDIKNLETGIKINIKNN